jgi:hypothetical protein
MLLPLALFYPNLKAVFVLSRLRMVISLFVLDHPLKQFSPFPEDPDQSLFANSVESGDDHLS